MKYHHPQQRFYRLFSRAVLILVTPVTSMTIGLPRARGADSNNDASLQTVVEQLTAACVRKINEDPDLSKWEKTIHVDPFVEIDDPQQKISRGISQRLETEFEKSKFTVAAKGNFKLRGTISKNVGRELPDDDFQSPALEIAPEIVDENGDPLWAINPIRVYTRDALQQLGPNFSVKPDLPLERQITTLLDHLDHPKPFVSENSILFPREDASFGIEIRIGEKTLPVVVDGESRNPTVYLKHGDEYRVRLHNRAPFTTGVRLSIDGVSMFALATDLSDDSLIVVPPGETIEIRGWWIRSKGEGGMTAFRAGEPAKSVAAQLTPSTTEIGTISAAFHAMWSLDETPPEDEALGTRGSLGTQQGVALSTNNPVVRNMVFGVCRSTVSVNYDANPN